MVILTSLFSCHNQSLNDFKEEGQAISRLLVAELKNIRSRDDLVEHAPKLQELFDRLVTVIIQSQEFKSKHPNATCTVSPNEQSVCEQLRIELNRVLHMEGGREVIERTQEAALNRLDTFEKQRLLL